MNLIMGCQIPNLIIKGSLKPQCATSWWFLTNPSQKYARQFGSFPPIFGMNINNFFELPPPRQYNIILKTNIAPENRPLEKENPIGNHHVQGLF